MRTDLPSMNAGKAMAQASHASNQMVHHIRNSKNDTLQGDLNEWQSEANGFGTCIVLGATGKEIDNLINGLDHMVDTVFVAGQVIDPTYPFFASKEYVDLFDKDAVTAVLDVIRDDGTMLFLRKEMTCAYLFGEKEEIEGYVSHLNLHP